MVTKLGRGRKGDVKFCAKCGGKTVRPERESCKTCGCTEWSHAKRGPALSLGAEASEAMWSPEIRAGVERLRAQFADATLRDVVDALATSRDHHLGRARLKLQRQLSLASLGGGVSAPGLRTDQALEWGGGTSAPGLRTGCMPPQVACPHDSPRDSACDGDAEVMEERDQQAQPLDANFMWL